MNPGHWIAALGSRSLPARLCLLLGGMLTVWAALALPALEWHGAVGLAALSLAAGACAASAVAAMLIGACLRSPAVALAGVLLPMSVRIFTPLAAAVVVRLRGPGLVEAGFAYYLIAFYLLALAVEVPLSLPRLQTQPCPAVDAAREERKTHG